MKYSYLKHLGSAIIVMALILLAFGSSDDGGDGTSSTSTKAPDKIDAWVMAQQFVEDRLKSPSTADFGSAFGDYQDPEKVVTDLGGDKFSVRAWVDSQNSFGATIRTHFVCEVEYLGNERWQLNNFSFNE